MRDWTVQARDAFISGKSITLQVRGRSMTGRIEDGDLVTLALCKRKELAIGDAVLVTVAGRRRQVTVLHLIHEIENGKFLIGNNVGRIDGWVTYDAIHGKFDALTVGLPNLQEDKRTQTGTSEKP